MKHRLFETAGATTTPFHHQSFGRCNGHMEQEMCMDLESDSGYSTCWVLRCLQCGDMVDETILKNRSLSMHMRSPEDRTNRIVPEAHARSHHEFSLT